MCLLHIVEPIDVEFTTLGRMTMSMANKLYKLPHALITPGQFGIATDFDENDVGHWLLPIEDVVQTYLVESPQTHDLTDLCSFYMTTLTILGNSEIHNYYNVATETSFPQLMNDALIVSKQKGFDILYALDVMHNESFFKELRFDPGDGQIHTRRELTLISKLNANMQMTIVST
ncbi:unnamed protein product [Thlaspi arvense]|uniref:Glycylpeptide N-tetradecanoyltransferase n=1 Tax=Thlaspi arvense TaxID=13288 RepID=A0AAU9S601_THLAR|nr:unnamed protein product [Thlaspi arvense]